MSGHTNGQANGEGYQIGHAVVNGAMDAELSDIVVHLLEIFHTRTRAMMRGLSIPESRLMKVLTELATILLNEDLVRWDGDAECDLMARRIRRAILDALIWGSFQEA